MELDLGPVTPDRWDDLTELAGERGRDRADDGVLDGMLPGYAQPLLEPDQVERVRRGGRGRPLGERAHAEVHGVGEREDRQLADRLVAR